MEEQSKLRSLILKSAYAIVIVLIIAVVALLILKYDVEGEKNMPFKLSSIIVASTAEGIQKENEEYKWDAEIYQNNDIYINIEKNKNYKETEIIKSITIDNIQINKEPQVGKMFLYRAKAEENNLFSNNDEFLINDRVEYIGDTNSDLKNLKISNQGGTLILRVINKTGKRYVSNDDEFSHDGRLLNKVNISYEQIKSTTSFDLTITLESGIIFKANIKLELPVGDITKDGSASLENSGKDIVFKRE